MEGIQGGAKTEAQAKILDSCIVPASFSMFPFVFKAQPGFIQSSGEIRFRVLLGVFRVQDLGFRVVIHSGFCVCI